MNAHINSKKTQLEEMLLTLQIILIKHPKLLLSGVWNMRNIDFSIDLFFKGSHIAMLYRYIYASKDLFVLNDVFIDITKLSYFIVIENELF